MWGAFFIVNSEKNVLDAAISGGLCVVLGLGVSNLPLIDYLLQRGARVEARDRKAFDDLPDSVRAFHGKGVSFFCGDGYLDGITAAAGDVIFRSPGIRPDAGSIGDACARGALLSSEMELFFALTPARIIGITGSDGKTTTTTVTGLFLKKAFEGSDRHVYVGGNIGAPLLPEMPQMTARDIAVVELSSFQLSTMRHAPDISVITNITPNHLNWHRDMAEYAAAKKNILGDGCGLCILNYENEATRGIGLSARKSVRFFSSAGEPPRSASSSAVYTENGYIVLRDSDETHRLISLSDIKLPGRHNTENYMAALAAVYGIVSPGDAAFVARTFGGVEHRLEFVRETGGVRYYNSSIDSSPTRTAAALSSFPDKSVVICGGYDKHIPFEPLAETLCGKATTAVLTGATREAIKAAVDKCPDYPGSGLSVIMEPDFTKAVLAAKEAAGGKGRVILSPACASFDAFANFEERGKLFKSIVMSL